jgi:hypothetical protein
MFRLHVLDRAERNDVAPPETIVVLDNPYVAR